jgi:hypothetical protein
MDTLSLLSARTSTTRERLFVNYLNGFIQEELSFLQSSDISQERFIIFKQAFNKVCIGHKSKFCVF